MHVAKRVDKGATLPVRVNAPLFVTRKLMEQAGIERGSMGSTPVEVDEDDDEGDDKDVDLGVSR